MYHKLKDNWQDERDFISAGGLLAFKSTYNKAAKRNIKANGIIIEALQELNNLESEKCNSFDQAAEPFAQMMKKLISEGYYGDDEKNKRKLEWMGYNIGKWIYVIDAYDDLEKDINKSCYNPLLLQFGYEGQNIDDFKASIYNEVKSCLTHTLWQASNAMELINLKNKGIIDNILYEGMYKKMESILDKRSCKKHG
jgi:alpha-galactosidase/6-phospho-beta-glucosidase family protein